MNLVNPETGEAVELVAKHEAPRPTDALSRIYDRVNAIGGVPDNKIDAGRNDVVDEVLAGLLGGVALAADLEIAIELLSDLLSLDAEREAIGGGPGFRGRWRAAIDRASAFLGNDQ